MPLIDVALSVLPLACFGRAFLENEEGMWWASLLMFILLGSFALSRSLLLLPGCSCLKVSDNGLIIRHYWRDHLVPWPTIHKLGVVMVQEVVIKSTHLRARIGLRVGGCLDSSLKGTGLRRLAKEDKGFNAVLPDNYRQDPDVLALQLDGLRLKHETMRATTHGYRGG